MGGVAGTAGNVIVIHVMGFRAVGKAVFPGSQNENGGDAESGLRVLQRPEAENWKPARTVFPDINNVIAAQLPGFGGQDLPDLIVSNLLFQK